MVITNKRLWKQTQAELQIILSKTHYKLFFSNTSLFKTELKKNHTLCTITVPNLYIKDSIAASYLSVLTKTLSSLLNQPVKIKLMVKPIKTKDLGPLFTQPIKSDLPPNNVGVDLKKARLRPIFTFDNFAVSSSNEMAYAAAKAVARTLGKAYNPLFFYGGVGVGKTHLMQAIAHEILKKQKTGKILYCTGEEFTNEIIEAIQSKRTVLFRKKYRLVNLLIIDDIQFIAGKNTVQEEFFHTFNALLQEGGQVILSSDRPPSEIQKLEARLASRFEAGLIVDIQEPNFELRTAILLIKAKMLNISLPMDVAQFVASKITSTRQLEGTLIRLKAFRQTQHKPLTPDLVGEILNLNHQNKPAKKVSPREIISQVAHYFNLKTSQLKGKERHQYIVLPRQIAMFLLRHDAQHSLVEVGRMFGGRDHTTVMHSVEKIKKLMTRSEEIRFNINTLRKNLF